MSVLLCCCLLFSALCLSVSAEDAALVLSDLTTQMKREVVEGSSTVTYSYSYNEGIVNRYGQQMHWFHAQNPDFYKSGGTKIVLSGGELGLAAGHEYEFTFYTDINVSMAYSVCVLLDGNRLFEDTGLKGFQKISVKFTAPDTIRDNSRISIIYSVAKEYNYGAGGEGVNYYISEHLEFFDRTDNPSWLGKIKQWFQDLGDKIGNFFSVLADRIGGFFTDLSNSISQWFQEQKKQIQEFFNGVKQWFQELGDRISGYFTDLYNDLIEGLKSLFIPADGYFDAYMQKTKDWAAERFGFLYTAGDLMVSMVNDLKGLLRDEYTFVLPAARFTLNGQTYTLWDEYTVPMGEYLQNNYMKFAYGTYKTLLGSVFAFALFKYAEKVFDKVMAN